MCNVMRHGPLRISSGDRLFCGIRCSFAHFLLGCFSYTLRLLGYVGCGHHRCETYISGYCICLICHARATVPFCCGMHPLHLWICLLFPSALTLSWVWSFPFLQQGPIAEALVQRHLLLARRRCFLLNFLLRSSIVCMSAVSRCFSTHMLSLLILKLAACMLIGSCLWNAFLARPSFRWNHQVTCLTKTVLHRWGVVAGFALRLPLSPRVF
jgi:hypothetical protein